MNLWPVVIVAGALTFLIRLSFIALLANLELHHYFNVRSDSCRRQ